MKIFKTLFTFFITILIASSAQAGIVTAFKMVHPETGKVVICFGENHSTHETFGEQDYLQTQKFIQCLEAAQESILILREDNGVRDKESVLHKTFLSSANEYLAKDGNPSHLTSVTIDHRSRELLEEFEKNVTLYFSVLKERFLKNQKISPEAFLFYIYEDMLSICEIVMSESLEKSIDLCVEASNLKVESILKDLVTTLGKRQLYFTRAIDFLKKSPNVMTRSAFHYFLEKEERLLKFFETFFYAYDSILVEAYALFSIANDWQKYDKFIVIAGANHLVNLEKWLEELGYEKTAYANHNFREKKHRIEILVNQYLLHLKEKALTENRGQLFDPHDNALDIFTIELDFYFLDRTISPAAVGSLSKIRAARNKYVAAVRLIPLETFSWINEDQISVETALKSTKRKSHETDGEEETNEQESYFVAKRKQPARSCKKS